MKDKIIKFIKNPLTIYTSLGHRGYLNFVNDEKYLKILYRIETHKRLNLDNPITFNEKLQWLKLNNRKDIYTTMVDKYEAKEYIGKIIGFEYIVPTLGVYNKFDDIDFNKLPNQFVIKCTHNSGGVFIVEDKKKFDYKKSRKMINKYMKNNFYNGQREWPYKNIKPRIIVEPFLKNKNNDKLIEYKIFCFNGTPKIIDVCYNDKFKKRYNDFYDEKFNRLYFSCTNKNSNNIIKKPLRFEEMIKISRVLSKNVPFLRVDFLLIDNKIKVGELTFFHYSGHGKFVPEEWDRKLGEYLDISKIK